MLSVAVVGCGTGGPAAALLLAAAGHRVEVFERVPEPSPVGAGLLLQPTGQAVAVLCCTRWRGSKRRKFVSALAGAKTGGLGTLDYDA